MRTYVITGMAKHAVPLGILKSRMDDESNSSAQVSSLLLALGNYPVTQLTKSERETEFLDRIAQFYTEHPDAGVHSAAEWVLERWEMDGLRAELDKQIRAKPAVEKQNLGWGSGPEGHTMAYIISSAGERFAIATKETTVAQFERSPIPMREFRKEKSPGPDCPVNSIPGYDAMRYCNWLSKQDNLPPSYEELDGIMRLKDNFEKLRGYRLPSSQELVEAELAGSTALTSFGNDPAMVKHFVWYMENSNGISQPVGRLMPNHFGLFDGIGNLAEVCHKSLADGRTGESCVTHGRWAGSGELGLHMKDFNIRTPSIDDASLHLPYSKATFRIVKVDKNP